MSTTPRTDAARGFHDMDTAVSAEDMAQLETELITACKILNDETNRAEKAEAELAALKAEFEKVTLLAAQTADRNVELRIRAEKAEADTARLRAAIIERIRVGESVGEDLIHNRAAQDRAGGEPLRRDNNRPVTTNICWRDTAEALVVDVVVSKLHRGGAVRDFEVIADRRGLTPNVDAGAPDITESIGELIRRIEDGIGSKEGGELLGTAGVALYRELVGSVMYLEAGHRTVRGSPREVHAGA